MTTQSQTDRILAHMKKGGGITPLQALRLYGSLRLGARIWDLKRAGYRIEKTMVRRGNKHFARYELRRA